MSRRLLPLLVLGCLAGDAGAADPAVVRVGMYTRQPPWVFVPGLAVDYSKPPASPSPTQLAKLAGFDVDVMHALGRHLGAPMQVVAVDWNRLEPGLLEGRYDLILSAWTPRPDTPEAIRASRAYCDWGLLIVTREGDARIRGPADLPDARVGHLDDPSVLRALGGLGGNAFRVLDNEDVLFGELRAGRLDAVLADSFYVRWRGAREPWLRVVGEPLNRLGYHVGVRREDAALLRRVDAALDQMLKRGEIDALRRRWEGGLRRLH